MFQALRFETDTGLKVFRQRTGPDQETWSIKGVRIVPYRLPELVEDIARGSAVFIVEGEKDVDNSTAARRCRDLQSDGRQEVVAGVQQDLGRR